ncbi:MAG: hydrolase, partial [bacterium]|nr:hydrolase [bacterium]
MKNWKNLAAASLVSAAVLLTLVVPALAEGHDIVILNGRVMDPETGFDAVANVGIDNGWITAITSEAIEGAETIDATGHVV